MSNKIGIGITEKDRPEVYNKSLSQIKKFLPPKAKLVIVDDASKVPVDNATVRNEVNLGVAASKNKCLELLQDCEHIFLFDSDTYPTEKDWWKPYTESGQNHLMYTFQNSPGHWPIKKILETDTLSVYDKPRGCMIYVRRKVLDVVGGMHLAFGKHGHEHEDWSRRIHEAGLSSYLFADVNNPKLYCMDQDRRISSVNYSENQDWRLVDPSRLTSYAEFREAPVPVMVARRYDNGHRDRLWQFLKDNYWAKLPYKIYEGYHTEGPFNRAQALNKAARLAGNWQVGIFADSDAYCDPERIQEGIKIALDTRRLVSVLNTVHELDIATTMRVLKTGNLWDNLTTEKIRVAELETQSNLIIVPRTLFERVQGFDEKFEGWGGEDNGFWRACFYAKGLPIRVKGPAYHLWHETADKSLIKNNHDRWRTYLHARTEQQIRGLRK